MKRIVLLYADAGGGHRSAAESIAKGIRMLYGERYEISFVNGFRLLPPLLGRLDIDYPMWVTYGRTLYALGYHASNGRRRLFAIRRAFEPISDKMAEDILRIAPADVYVSCHLVYNQTMPSVIRRLGSPAKFMNVVTDLVSGHVAHYAPDVDFCVVPTEESRRDAIANLVPPEKVIVAGQPVLPDFRERVAKGPETREALGLSHEIPVVLLMGGGAGMGRLELTAREIAFSNLPVQLIVVCGRNQTVKHNLEFINARIPMRVLGFVDNVPELMGAAHILVTKAGPGTIAEAFIAGLPIILYDRVPGQEEGNVDYVVNNGAGAWCPFPWMVVKQIRQWLSDPPKLDSLRSASAALAKPDSALEIARLVAQLAGD
ncbi:MAG: glycosyltransferase [Anaerolineae bacterium]|nr:glycosyltransferase [Thermoflexales bacterium]MDW8407510.1 glycosyltransferase [Anaerolineae bacterium]